MALRIPLPPIVLSLLPWIAVVVLLAANILLFVSGSSSGPGALWTGPEMPGKIMALPEQPEWLEAALSTSTPHQPAKPASPPSKMVLASPSQSEQTTPPAKLQTAPQPKAPAAHPVDTAQTAIQAAPEQRPPPVLESSTPQTAYDSPRYVVQAGSFVLEMGADSLMKRLKENGFTPILESTTETIQVNNVQAGPFASLEQAKQAEVRLKANGMDVEAEETWEGYIISLNKSYMLGYAIQDLELAKKLEITPVRIVKVATDLPVRKVIIGPFDTHKEAKAISAEVSHLGLAVPVIKKRFAPVGQQ
ncbi:MAG: SPOR domain-containing protein [Magnetococcales bacterium]|nr:SPOR domain-containing protein [Magnetococcales bacterium]